MRPALIAGPVAALLFAAALPPGPRAAEPGPDKLVLACAGAFARDSDAARLATVFGAANLRDEEVGGAEGETVKATVLYPDDPKRRLEINWWDEAGRRRPAGIRAREELSQWRVAGIGIGDDLGKASAANGKPFTLSGFGWDYGGLVADWNGGAVPKLAGAGCMVSVALSTEASGPDRIMGDGVMLRSDDGDVVAARPIVIEVGIGWPEQ